MAFTFGSFTPKNVSLSNVPFSLGSSVDTTDDARAARSRNQTYVRPQTTSPKFSTPRKPLTFTGVEKYNDPFRTGNNLSFPTGVVPANKRSTGSGLLSGASDFLKLASFGQSVTDTRSLPNVYDDGVLRAGRALDRTPELHTATIEGGTNTLDGLKGLAKGILSNIGSRGDGELVAQQVSFPGGQGGGGINPLYIAAAAVGAGVLYYVATK